MHQWGWIKVALAALILVLVVVSLVLGIVFDIKGIFISAYGAVVIPRTLFQLWFSIWNNFRNENLSRKHLRDYLVGNGYLLPKGGKWQRYVQWRTALYHLNPGLEARWQEVVRESMPRSHKIGVEVPVYGLTPEELRDTVVSILNQSVDISLVVVGLNQPDNYELIKAAYQMQQDLNDLRLQVIEMPEPGKRGAMYAGFKLIAQAGCEITVNVDGDTVLDRDAIYTALMLIDAQIGITAVTSNVNVRNRSQNLLTELTYQRYRYANEQERAAQSLFTGVTCMSGPLMVMKTVNVQEIAPEWSHETFLGVPIGPGDDRSLTMHHLRRGLGVGYSPASVVWTDCPEQLPAWQRQQLRWSRSGMREFLRALGWMYRLPVWAIFDQFYLMVFPFILGGVIGAIGAEFARNLVLHGWYAAYAHAVDYVVMITVVNLINGLIAVIRNRDPKFVLSAGYIIVHLRYLLAIKFHAMFTLPESAWLTRGGEKK